MTKSLLITGLIASGLSFLASPTVAQPQGQGPGPTNAPAAATCVAPASSPPTFNPVEQLADGNIIFRLCAPDALTVRLTSSDLGAVIPFDRSGLLMSKDSKGLWSVSTSKPVPADTYRYKFTVDGVSLPDPQGETRSDERFGLASTFEALGPSGAFQTYDRAVPHGTVTAVEYWSSSLGVKRRANVYTPPGYMKGSKTYPVLYLVHGSGDSDDSWVSIGRAHYILDNLIAVGKARPMIIVMPFGHTPSKPGEPVPMNNPAFGDDLIKDLIPSIDKSFRTVDNADGRAMAGLSMGGGHTINFGLTHPELFHYIGIFSSALTVGQPDLSVTENFARANDAALKRTAREVKFVYYAIGSADFVYPSVAPMRALLKHYGIKEIYQESGGGHTWVNWRRYLNDFAPRLFK